jgi:hypothetical protein
MFSEEKAMTTQGKSVAAGYALDCIARAEAATAKMPPNPEHELAKGIVYALLAISEILETTEVEPPVFGRD